MRLRTNCIVSAILLFSASFSKASEKPLVELIMERVENQDRAQQARREFVYRQNLIIRFTRGNGKLAREEVRELLVTPTPEQTEKTLICFAGKYEKDGKLLDYAEPGFRHKDLDLDGELINDFAEDFTSDKMSRDGLARDFFPLTSPEQRKYRFDLKGEEDHRGRSVYRITFEPRGKGWEEMEDAPWSGELLVDRVEYQPVQVTTRLAKDFPVAVKVLLGTDVQRLGFKVAYEKFAENIWFPVSYGGEFKVKAVFLYKRNIAIALTNTDFQRTNVSTRLVFDPSLEIMQPLKLPEIPPQAPFGQTKP